MVRPRIAPLRLSDSFNFGQLPVHPAYVYSFWDLNEIFSIEGD